MNPIIQGMDQGYSPEEILQFVSKAIPKLVPKINKAVANGYGIKEILGFLSKSSPQGKLEGVSETQIHRRNRDLDSQLTQKGLMAAGSAVATPLALNAARSALSRALPQSLAPATQTLGNLSNLADSAQSPQQMPSPQLPVNQSTNQQSQELSKNVSQQPPNVNQPNIAQPTPIPQVEEKNIQPPQEILDIQKKEKDIDNLWKAAHGDRGATLPENKELLRYSRSLLKSGDIRDYDSFKEFAKWWDATDGVKRNNPRAEFEKFRVQTQGMYPEKEAQQPNQAKEEVTQPETTISKGVSVGTPQGMGEVKELRNGKALININGKNHQVNENELIQSPLPEKEMGDLFDDLISGIEKQTGRKVSRNVEWAGYDPKNNELAYKPFGGDALWSYDNISPEDVEELTNLMTQRKSTGGNFIGTWEAGSTSPMGAAMYKLITKLQKERGGKGNEYKNKFLTFYDALEPAKIDAKRKHAERNKKAKKPRINQTPLLSLELQEEE